MSNKSGEPNNKRAEDWIARLELKPHPEGGYYREVYRSAEMTMGSALPDRFMGPRPHASAIYYLLDGNDFSAFHMLQSDEIWHFYDGSPLKIIMLNDNDTVDELTVGLGLGEPMIVVPRLKWFAARPLEKDSFSLLGCTVSPGFDFKDFILGKRNEMLEVFPRHRELILSYTRE